MPRLLDWIKSAAVKVMDPDREQRLDIYVPQVIQAIRVQRKQFDFDKIAEELRIDPSDNPIICEQVFARVVDKIWEDGHVSEQEKDTINWLTQVLHLKPEKAIKIQQQIGQTVFEYTLSEAMTHGEINDANALRLNQIATDMRISVRELTRRNFFPHCEAFLRSLFLKLVADGRLNDQDWKQLTNTAIKLGWTILELLSTIKPHSKIFIEHLLVDAKSDGIISDNEARIIISAMDRLQPDSSFRNYVEVQIKEIQYIEKIKKGYLPIISHSNIALDAGEIPHLYIPMVQYIESRQHHGNKYQNSYSGTAWVTDKRLIFMSSAKSFDINHRRILQIIQDGGGITVRIDGRGDGRFDLTSRLDILIYTVAVQKIKQTIVQTLDGQSTRHIPRDVRQRVWQKYGGRCAECGASVYLEFDHIVPVAKGGSNSENNVQLLCRRCNLKKSDMI